MAKRLYDLAAEYGWWVDLLDDAETPEQEEDALAHIENVKCAISEKADAYARIILAKQAEAAGYAAEIKRLTALKKSAENCVTRLKANMQDAMERAASDTIQTTTGAWKWKINPPSVEILDANDVPDDYKVYTCEVSKSAILAKYRETGEIIPGSDIVRKRVVVFK